MYNHNPKNDPYQYDASGRKLQNVIVDLNGKVDPATIRDILSCMRQGKPFVLFEDENMTYFDPVKKCSYTKPGDTTMMFQANKDFEHAVKLSLVTLTNLFIPKEPEALPGESKLIIEP